MASRPVIPQTYCIDGRTGDQLSNKDLDSVVELLRQGSAVDPESAAAELPWAIAVVLIKRENEIVGVGAIKRPRPWYAQWVQDKSEFSFATELPELGYVAVAEQHRGGKLSKGIVAKLLDGFAGPIFSTTDDARMKRTLAQFGFASKGQEWKGERGKLSLWLRCDTSTPAVPNAKSDT